MCAGVNKDPLVDMNEKIWSAVWKNDLDTLNSLLRRSPKEAINYKHDSGKTALHTAALNIHLDCARLLIGKLVTEFIVPLVDTFSHTNMELLDYLCGEGVDLPLD